MSRQDLVIRTATVANVPLGRFQRGSGGDLTATGHKAWNGGIGEVERGGRKTQSNIVLARENTGSPTLAQLRAWVNQPARIHRTPADDTGNPRLAEQVEYTGRLLEVRADDADTMNDGDIEMIELEFGVDT